MEGSIVGEILHSLDVFIGGLLGMIVTLVRPFVVVMISRVALFLLPGKVKLLEQVDCKFLSIPDSPGLAHIGSEEDLEVLREEYLDKLKFELEDGLDEFEVRRVEVIEEPGVVALEFCCHHLLVLRFPLLI